ncbi:hypothetical protein JW848_11310 [Candidatus Bipolaricaulota bacterium]|nr:hypothetical protein [Candidatus Bipolaricaulota bacterium]
MLVSLIVGVFGHGGMRIRTTAVLDQAWVVVIVSWQGKLAHPPGATPSHTLDALQGYAIILSVIDRTGAPAFAAGEVNVWVPAVPDRSSLRGVDRFVRGYGS